MMLNVSWKLRVNRGKKRRENSWGERGKEIDRQTERQRERQICRY